MLLTDSIKRQIADYATSNSTEEVCGFVAEGHAIPCRNLAPDRSHNFMLTIPAGVRAEAIWHSHPLDTQAGELSLEDLERCKFNRDGLPYILYHPVFDCWDYYDPKSANPSLLKRGGDPTILEFYLGWKFVWGRSDCFGLVRSYYLGKLGIDIGDFKRPSLHNFPPADYLAPWQAEEHGFMLLPPGTSVQTNDIVEIALKGGVNANHIGVIVNAEQMQLLHNLGADYTSQVGLYGSYWQSRTVKLFRHKNYA